MKAITLMLFIIGLAELLALTYLLLFNEILTSNEKNILFAISLTSLDIATFIATATSHYILKK